MVDLISKFSFILLAKSSSDSTSMDPTMKYIIFSLIGFFIFILVIVFLRNRVLPILKLWYIILIYGKFSFEFLEFFKANNLRNPHNSCIKDEITMHFLLFFKKINNAEYFTTNNYLEYGKIPFLMPYKSLVKQMGNPECINIARFNGIKVRVVGYNELLGGMKMKSLYYFINEVFVMGEYFFSEMNLINPKQIVEILSSKYLDHQEIAADCFYIIDPSGNKLNYENNGFSINIRYLYLCDDDTNSILESIFPGGTTGGPGFQKAMKDEELLNRF